MEIKSEHTFYSWNSFLEAFLYPPIYKAFCVGEKIVFVKIGNMFWFWLAGAMCFCPIVIPILSTLGKISKARRTIQKGNIDVLTSDPDNLTLVVDKNHKPALERGLMGQNCIEIEGRKIYSHFTLDKNGLKKLIDECWK
ncbi:MAG TPA: hypothetical protein PLK94_14735 [Alphaproteobacteria bacterium]|nr:hypothetical protein [Alphaproteobacteria bacterium]